MKLLVVIVNYRSADLTIDCLASLLPELDQIPGASVVVTDNASGDESVPRLEKAVRDNAWSAWVKVLPLPHNGGFAYGNNAGIAPMLAGQDKPQYVLLLNPDTVVRPRAITSLLQFMDENPKAGIAGSRLEDLDGTPQRSAFRFHSITSEFERGIRIGFVSRLLKRKLIALPIPDTAAACDWVAGASMMIRREVFESIGLMDEKYFMYFEEVDFCLAASRSGWPCWYVPASHVVHLVGAVSQMSDSRKHRKRRPAYWFESRRRFFVKNYGRAYSALADLSYLLGGFVHRIRWWIQRTEDTDPPKLFADSLSHSVFIKGFST